MEPGETRGAMSLPGATVEVEIFYEDTDCGGVVYYANYLRYFERARTLAMRGMGIDVAKWAKDGVLFTVIRAQIEYKAPAMYGDILEVETVIRDVKGARLTFDYSITNKRDGRLTVTGATDMACVDSAMKPRRIPDEITKIIS